VALRVADPDRSAAFYREVLGLSEHRRLSDGEGLRAVWLRAGEVVLMLERELRGKGTGAGSGHLLAFRVAGLEEWTARLARRGVAVEDRTDHTLYLRDPDGHRVGLSDLQFDA
jgi:catechol 2,3-dioxygenase-like lactoylglutathione lyase family enzyme